MASIRREMVLGARAAAVWDAVRDVGSLHTRVCPGFVTDCRMEGPDARIVTFGNGSESSLQGRTLVHQPYYRADESVVWRCGLALPPQGSTPLSENAPAAVTTIEARYLPSACRP